MVIIECTRRLQFCAGHRLVNHEGRCAHMHGHNYVVFVTAVRTRCFESVDTVGRVIDFSVLKVRLGTWIDEHWDHQFIVNIDDTVVIDFLRIEKYPMFVLHANPTAENMATCLLNICNDVLFAHGTITITKIVLWETENCFAEVTACPKDV